MEYKVIKAFGAAREGDVMTSDDNGYVSFNVTEKKGKSEYTRAMAIDEFTADDLVEDGFLEVIGDECECEERTCCPCKKIDDTVELIDNLLGKYDEDHTETLKKAEKGEIPPCVKVEAETVYYNLKKVLERIKKELVNE